MVIGYNPANGLFQMRSGRFLFLLLLVLPAAGVQAEEKAIPQPIQEYYRGYNFVCALSTEAERFRLTGLGHFGVQPQEERLREVRRKMGKLEQYLWKVDSAIQLPGQRFRVFDGLQFVQRISRSGRGELVLEVRVQRLSYEQNIRLIRLYELQKLSPENWEEDLTGGESSHLEYHRWRWAHGAWYRDEAAWIPAR